MSKLYFQTGDHCEDYIGDGHGENLTGDGDCGGGGHVNLEPFSIKCNSIHNPNRQDVGCVVCDM